MRVKKGKHAIKRRRKVLKAAKGYRHGRKSKEKEAKQAVIRANTNRRAHRRTKKRDMRGLWNIKIGAKTRELGMPYSRFIDALKKNNIALNRKMLAELAEHDETAFKAIFDKVAS